MISECSTAANGNFLMLEVIEYLEKEKVRWVREHQNNLEIHKEIVFKLLIINMTINCLIYLQ